MSARWTAPETVAGFVKSPPNERLLALAQATLDTAGAGILVDIGCGAGRNTEPLASQGWAIAGLDLSMPMLLAATARARLHSRPVTLLCAAMDRLPLAAACADFVVAHGIWNLARSATEFRAAVREARRVAKRGATLFVFTFSRNTLSDDAQPIDGEPFVFTQFSGEPQCFLTRDQLLRELADRGFAPDERLPLTELNRRQPGALTAGGGPVIFEGAFRAV